MPLQGHWTRVNTPLRETTGRERRIVVIAASLFALAAIIGTIVAIGSSSPATPSGCIRIEVPSTMGASASNICGNKAISAFCHGAAANSPPLNATALPKCRNAGY